MTTGTHTVESPCINVCTLDEQDVCVGCQRTLDEIGRWSLSTPTQQLEILRRVAVRRTLVDGAADEP